MASAVNRAAAALLLLPLGAGAQDLRDPTEPPALVRAPQVSASAPAPGSGEPQLQSVLVSPQRRVAVIDGVTVRLGQSFHGAILTHVSATEVELTSASGHRILKLHSAAAHAAAKVEKNEN